MLLTAWLGLSGLGRAGETGVATNDPESVVRAVLAVHTNYLHILDGNPIVFAATSRVDAAFEMAQEIAPEIELVGKISQALVDYSFTLRRAEGYQKYRFTNTEKDDCDIVVLNITSETNHYAMTMVAEGDRFFGAFEALIHLESRKDVDGRITYAVYLYGYPKSAMWRFVARNIGKIRRYFVDRVMAVMNITSRTYEAMARDPEKAMQMITQYGDSRASLHFTGSDRDRIRDLLVRHAGLPAKGSDPGNPDPASRP